MRTTVSLLGTCLLSFLPSARSLVFGRSVGVPNNHGDSRSRCTTSGSRFGYSRIRSFRPIRRSLSGDTLMMAKPSQPVPRNVKDTVSSLRAAVQEGLNARQSRMDVDLPIAARLGVEATEDDKNKKTATAADVERSDRELARLFLEMFDVIGEQVVVAFPTDEEAQKAENVWSKGAPFKGRVTSMNPRAKKGPQLKRGSEAFLGFAKNLEAKKKKNKATGGTGGSSNGTGEGAEGGGALAGKPALARIVPPGTEVLLVVAPKRSELMTVQKLSKGLGQGCLIVLLNARLHQANFFDDEQRQFYEEEFESMFHLRPVGMGTEDFLFRAYPKDWTVARKPKIGPPKVLRSQEKRPTQAEITAAVEEGDKAAGVFGNLL